MNFFFITSYGFSFILFFLICNKTHAQHYRLDLVENSYTFYLNKDQVISAGQLVYDDDTEELWRTVGFPKEAIEIFDGRSGRLKKTIPTPGMYGTFFKSENGEIYIQNTDEGYSVLRNWKVDKILQEPILGTKGHTSISNRYGFTSLLFYKGTIFKTGYLISLIPKTGKIDATSESYKGQKIIRCIDTNGQISYIGKKDTSSLDYYWGGLNGYSIALFGDNLLVSPVFNSNLQVINLVSHTTKEKSVPSKYDELIRPLDDIKNINNYSYADANNHYIKSYAYDGILHDKYRNVFYRFVKHNGNSFTAKHSMIVMDENLNILCFYDIPASLNTNLFFVSKKGLHMANMVKYNSNDNLMIFELLKLNKI